MKASRAVVSSSAAAIAVPALAKATSSTAAHEILRRILSSGKIPVYASGTVVSNDLPLRLLCRANGARLAYTGPLHAGHFCNHARYRYDNLYAVEGHVNYNQQQSTKTAVKNSNRATTNAAVVAAATQAATVATGGSKLAEPTLLQFLLTRDTALQDLVDAANLARVSERFAGLDLQLGVRHTTASKAAATGYSHSNSNSCAWWRDSTEGLAHVCGVVEELRQRIDAPVTCTLDQQPLERAVVDFVDDAAAARQLAEAGCALLAITTPGEAGTAHTVATQNQWSAVGSVVTAVTSLSASSFSAGGGGGGSCQINGAHAFTDTSHNRANAEEQGVYSMPVIVHTSAVTTPVEAALCLNMSRASGVVASDGLLGNPVLFNNVKDCSSTKGESSSDGDLNSSSTCSSGNCINSFDAMDSVAGKINGPAAAAAYLQLCAQYPGSAAAVQRNLAHMVHPWLTDPVADTQALIGCATIRQFRQWFEQRVDIFGQDSGNSFSVGAPLPPELASVLNSLSRSAVKKLNRAGRLGRGSGCSGTKRMMIRADKRDNNDLKRETQRQEQQYSAASQSPAQSNKISPPSHENAATGEVAATLTKRQYKAEQRRRAHTVMADDTGALRVAIDLSHDTHMNEKEIASLCNQIRRLYGHNLRAVNPAHIYLTGLEPNGRIDERCHELSPGFEDYVLTVTHHHFSQRGGLPRDRNTVYLSPDSPNALWEVRSDTQYVLGGLVDEHLLANTTLAAAAAVDVQTARLPIQELTVRDRDKAYAPVLAINQVFEALQTLHAGGNWTEALEAALPRRKGFSLRDRSETEEIVGAALKKNSTISRS